MTFYQKELERVKANCYSNSSQIKTVIATRRYINSNFDKSINLNRLSDAGFKSKFHLLRLFRKYYGQTPIQYLTDKRIEKAKEFLSHGINVSQACVDVGFESHCSFSTLFKSRVGLTPTEFQKRAIFAKRV